MMLEQGLIESVHTVVDDILSKVTTVTHISFITNVNKHLPEDFHVPDCLTDPHILIETYRNIHFLDEEVLANLVKADTENCWLDKPLTPSRNRTQGIWKIGLECSVCQKTYIGTNTAARHMRIHSGEKPLECKICGKRATEDSVHATHLLGRHTDKRKHTCLECTSTFSSMLRLRRHMISIHSTRYPSKAWFCAPCRTIYPDECELTKHLDMAICNRSGHMEAIRCRRGRKKKPRLQVVQRKKRNVVINYAETIKQKYHYKQTTSTGKKGKTGIFKCDECGALLRSHSKLKGHMKIHEVASGKGSKTKCSTCGKQCQSRELLQKHIVVHQGMAPYMCHVCEKTFANVDALLEHKFEQHKCSEWNYNCKVCSELIVSDLELHRHSTKHIMAEAIGGVFACPVCGKAVNGTAGLQRHLRSIHTGEKPFFCSKCGYSNGDSSYIMKHVRTCKGKRGGSAIIHFKCSSCLRVFVERGKYNKHIKCHKDRGQCMNCGRKFAWSYLLHQHTASECCGIKNKEASEEVGKYRSNKIGRDLDRELTPDGIGKEYVRKDIGEINKEVCGKSTPDADREIGKERKGTCSIVDPNDKIRIYVRNGENAQVRGIGEGIKTKRIIKRRYKRRGKSGKCGSKFPPKMQSESETSEDAGKMKTTRPMAIIQGVRKECSPLETATVIKSDDRHGGDRRYSQRILITSPNEESGLATTDVNAYSNLRANMLEEMNNVSAKDESRNVNAHRETLMRYLDEDDNMIITDVLRRKFPAASNLGSNSHSLLANKNAQVRVKLTARKSTSPHVIETRVRTLNDDMVVDGFDTSGLPRKRMRYSFETNGTTTTHYFNENLIDGSGGTGSHSPFPILNQHTLTSN